MPQTDPFTYNVPRKMTDSELARALKLDAAAELDAMNLYEAHIDATDNEDAKRLLAFIAKDEKEHYALFVELIKRLDPEQAAELVDAAPKLNAILSTPRGAVSEDAIHETTANRPVSSIAEERDLLRRSTVGSLLGQHQDGRA